MDELQISNLLSTAQCEGDMDHVLDLCDGLTLPQLDVLQRQIRDRRNARAGFLRLPGELRNRIYEMVIESEILHPASSTQYVDLASLKKVLVGVPGFNICKQARSEFQSFLQPDCIEICRYDDAKAAFLPIGMETFRTFVRNAHWFRALRCDDLEVAQKSVMLCDDEIGVDCCGIISFGPALGLRPIFYVVDFKETGYASTFTT